MIPSTQPPSGASAQRLVTSLLSVLSLVLPLFMPASGCGRKRAYEDPDYEEWIQQAIEELRKSVYLSINAAAKAFNICTHLDLQS